MLTNLDWLEPGRAYPPPQEELRINRYKINEALFMSNHSAVWEDDYEELARILRKSAREVQTVFNYHQLLSKKTADFVCGEPPAIETEGDTDGLIKLLRKQRFFAKLYESIIDVSRFGNAVPKIVGNRMSVVSAKYWFPVLDPTDLKNIQYHVIAYPTEPDSSGKLTKLYTEIHTQGTVETRVYEYSGNDLKNGESGKIGNLIAASKVENTGFDDFAVQPLTNVTHSGSIYGLDDYIIVNSLIEKLMWRLHCADTILDKHSEPSVSGPGSALELDYKTGLYFLNLGNYFRRDNREDPDVSYITWDGNLEANFKEIDLLFNQLYILSEMGSAFLEGNSMGTAASGTALKLRLVAPRIKAQRIAGLNDAPVRSLIHMLAEANGVHIEADDLQLTWHDGLPDDPVEDANRRSVETSGKQTKSQFSAIKERGLSDEEAYAELEEIRLEAAANMGNVLTATDPTAGELLDAPEDEELEGNVE